MQSMVNRWKDRLGSIEDKQSINTLSHPPRPEPINQTIAVPDHDLKQSNLSMKKSLEKSKKSLHSHEEKIQSSKRITTPSKRKKCNKTQIIEKSCEDIFQIFAKLTLNDKALHAKIKTVLEDMWAKSLQIFEAESIANMQGVKDLETSMMRQSTLSSSAAKRQERLYQDLEKRYFDCEKQRQFLKSRLEEIVKKYQNVERQLERYAKMQKLIDKCIEREKEAKEESKRLLQQLELADLRHTQQQRIFENEVNIVRALVEEIKKSLPQT